MQVEFKSSPDQPAELLSLSELKDKFDPDEGIVEVEVIGSPTLMIRKYLSRLIIAFIIVSCSVVVFALANLVRLLCSPSWYRASGSVCKLSPSQSLMTTFYDGFYGSIIWLALFILILSSACCILHYLFTVRITGSRFAFFKTVHNITDYLVYLILPCVFSYFSTVWSLLTFPVVFWVLCWLRSVSRKFIQDLVPDKRYDKPTKFLLVKSSLSNWCYFESKGNYLLVIKGYSYRGINEQIVRSDDCTKSITLFIDWLDGRSKGDPDREAAYPPQDLFVRESFDYLAKEKCYDRLDVLLRSPSLGAKGNKWTGQFHIIDEKSEKSIKEHSDGSMFLRSDMNEEIVTEIRVLKYPLYKLPLLNFFHSYVVIRTMNRGTGKEMWWSMDKNANYIVVQKNADDSKVVDYVAGDKRCQCFYPRTPQTVMEHNDVGEKLLADVIDLFDKEEPYHWISNNCQDFSRRIFQIFAGKCLDYGVIPNYLDRLGQLSVKNSVILQAMFELFKGVVIAYYISCQIVIFDIAEVTF